MTPGNASNKLRCNPRRHNNLIERSSANLLFTLAKLLFLSQDIVEIPLVPLFIEAVNLTILLLSLNRVKDYRYSHIIADDFDRQCYRIR